ncbi:hypothetical protein KCU83_g436, partial [Aureobasidium melanogenum]
MVVWIVSGGKDDQSRACLFLHSSLSGFLAISSGLLLLACGEGYKIPRELLILDTVYAVPWTLVGRCWFPQSDSSALLVS